jgi:hypothetical protein
LTRANCDLPAMSARTEWLIDCYGVERHGERNHAQHSLCPKIRNQSARSYESIATRHVDWAVSMVCIHPIPGAILFGPDANGATVRFRAPTSRTH